MGASSLLVDIIFLSLFLQGDSLFSGTENVSSVLSLMLILRSSSAAP